MDFERLGWGSGLEAPQVEVAGQESEEEDGEDGGDPQPFLGAEDEPVAGRLFHDTAMLTSRPGTTITLRIVFPSSHF